MDRTERSFQKNRKERPERSFQKNRKERPELNVLFKRTGAHPCQKGYIYEKNRGQKSCGTVSLRVSTSLQYVPLLVCCITFYTTEFSKMQVILPKKFETIHNEIKY